LDENERRPTYDHELDYVAVTLRSSGASHPGRAAADSHPAPARPG